MKPVIRVPEGSYYAAVEGSRGEFGVYLESRGRQIAVPPEIPFDGPAARFVYGHHYAGCEDRRPDCIGGTLDYVVPDIDR